LPGPGLSPYFRSLLATLFVTLKVLFRFIFGIFSKSDGSFLKYFPRSARIGQFVIKFYLPGV